MQGRGAMKRLVMMSAWLLAAAANAAPTPAPGPEAALQTALSALMPDAKVTLKRSDDWVVVTVSGAAPDWAALRELGRKAFAAVAAHDPGQRVELWFEQAGVVARASLLEGSDQFRVEVGDGDVMLDERARYGLAARAKITVKALMLADAPLGMTGRPRCAGEVENLGASEVTVVARCTISGPSTSPLGQPQPRALLVDQTQPVGAVAPGAVTKFAATLPAVKPPHSVLLPGESVSSGLVASVTFLVGGTATPHLDLDRFDLATDWLRVMDALRADGFTVTSYRPLMDPAVKAMFDELVLSGPDDLAERPAAERKALGKRLWKLVQEHYRRFKRPWPRKGVRVVARGKSAGLSGGKLGKFE